MVRQERAFEEFYVLIYIKKIKKIPKNGHNGTDCLSSMLKDLERDYKRNREGKKKLYIEKTDSRDQNMAILFKKYPSSGQVISEYPIVSRGLYTDTRLSYLLFKLRNTCLEGVCRDPKYFKLTKLKINGSRYEVLSKCHTKIRTKMTM